VTCVADGLLRVLTALLDDGRVDHAVPVYIAAYTYVTELPDFAARTAYIARLYDVGVRLAALTQPGARFASSP
jgi:hypothetical protein